MTHSCSYYMKQLTNVFFQIITNFQDVIVYEAREVLNKVLYVDAHAPERSNGYPYYIKFHQNDILIVKLHRFLITKG